MVNVHGNKCQVKWQINDNGSTWLSLLLLYCQKHCDCSVMWKCNDLPALSDSRFGTLQGMLESCGVMQEGDGAPGSRCQLVSWLFCLCLDRKLPLVVMVEHSQRPDSLQMFFVFFLTYSCVTQVPLRKIAQRTASNLCR